MTTVKGKIEETQIAKSRKTLGVKVNGKWYRTKEFTLEHEVGTVIDFDVSTSSLQDGTTLYWINNYQLIYDDTPQETAPPPPPVAETTRREQARKPDIEAAAYTENAMLLRFIGQCFAGTNYSAVDEPMIRNRARMLYRMGKDILSGKIEEVETGPRRESKPERDPSKGIPGYSPLPPNDGEHDPDQTDGGFDDEIPF